MGAKLVPRRRGGRARLGAGAAAEAVSSGEPSRATMARCSEAGARLVARADLRVAQARIPCRRRLAGIPRNHLSLFVCPSPRRSQESADRASSGRAAHAPAKRRYHAKPAARTDRRCDFDPKTSRRNRGPCRSRALGRRSALGGQQLAHGYARRAPFSLRDADQGAGKGHRQRGVCTEQTARIENAVFPLWRSEQLDSMRGCRRGLFESRSEARYVRLARSNSAVASSSHAAQGHPVNTGRDTRGGLLLVTFLGRARKVTSRRAGPGLAKRHQQHAGDGQRRGPSTCPSKA
jgi:hypothetical protein